jgi:sulfhydrogenase subunit beta (sulfur reductase)
MSVSSVETGAKAVLESSHIQDLLDVLKSQGYQVIGPTVRDGAIVYDELESAADLPVGWTDEQGAGTYRLKRRADGALFGYAVGPHSWKRFLHPPVLRLWRARRDGSGFEVIPEKIDAPRLAFVGVRSCELHAISIQDRVLLHGAYADPVYASRRKNLFLVAVHCAQAGGSCFCASMGTGPKAVSGYDLALTEVVKKNRHVFVVEVGTTRGAAALRETPHAAAAEEDVAAAEAVTAKTAGQMGRKLNTNRLPELLRRNFEHPRWDDAAARCMTCGNCTLVCPTCFCTNVEEVTDLTGEHAERWRRWDSCFTMDFSFIYGGSVRYTPMSRYRQWVTHKLAAWVDQFGVSGCVGCGRCITWCPVGLDITEEVRAIRAADHASKENANGDD